MFGTIKHDYVLFEIWKYLKLWAENLFKAAILILATKQYLNFKILCYQFLEVLITIFDSFYEKYTSRFLKVSQLDLKIYFSMHLQALQAKLIPSMTDRCLKNIYMYMMIWDISMVNTFVLSYSNWKKKDAFLSSDNQTSWYISEQAASVDPSFTIQPTLYLIELNITCYKQTKQGGGISAVEDPMTLSTVVGPLQKFFLTRILTGWKGVVPSWDLYDQLVSRVLTGHFGWSFKLPKLLIGRFFLKLIPLNERSNSL